MALYTVFKALLDANINTNGIQYITGAIHNDVMNEMVDVVGQAQVYVNPATTDNPGTPANPRAYIAMPGTYTNFGGLTVTGSFGVLSWDGTDWSVESFNIGGATNGIIRCETTAPLTISTTITSAAIQDVNGLGWTAFAGQWVKLINRVTGVFDFVQLSANLAEGATTMSISSYQLQQSFPTGSIVECYPVTDMRTWGSIPVVGAGLNFVNVTGTWRMPPVEAIQYTVYLELLEVSRNGLPCRYAATPTSEREYTLDASDRTKVIFGTDFVDGEEVAIKYRQPTVL